MTKNIELYGVETNNLKNIDALFPHRQMTILTGVSGSGKSSLAFDTLYAEGQRRFLESMSTYTRQFLNQMPKPPIRRLENILPAIALRQQSNFAHVRSTVASVSEVLDFIGLFYTNNGEQRCVNCGDIVQTDNILSISKALDESGNGKLRLMVLAEQRIPAHDRPHFLSRLVERGYMRLWKDGQIISLEGTPLDSLFDAEEYVILIDRVTHTTGEPPSSRLIEAAEEGFRLGDGRLRIDIHGESIQTLRFDTHFSCRNCHKVYPALRAEFFNPNSTLGACPVCTGFGRVSGIDWHKVIPNPQLSIAEHAIKPFSTRAKRLRYNKLLGFCAQNGIDTHKPWYALTTAEQNLVKFGKGSYHGVTSFFEDLESRTNKFINRITLAHYRGYLPCETCGGCGFSEQTRHVYVNGKTMPDLMQMTVDQVLEAFKAIRAEKNADLESKSEYFLTETLSRLQTMHDVGLGYLTLNRQTKTLSGGEMQRLHLSTGLGRGLTDTLYVLDEPTAGLHARDSLRLIRVMESLRDMGNTVVVVEHDADVIAHGDHILELGPGGGERGGKILFEGTFDELKASDTPTGHIFNHQKHTVFEEKTLRHTNRIEIRNATLNNLDHLNVDIPLGCLVCVTGVSGSGKSTLVNDILYNTWKAAQNADDDDEPEEDMDDTRDASEEPSENIGNHAEIRGLERISEMILMEQGTLGRSTRANAATMTKAYDEIRKLLSDTNVAKTNGIEPRHFSFNMPDGRCPRCEGHGTVTVEMQFLSDIEMTCEECGGKRFQPQVLEVTWHGKNVDDILNLTVEEAIAFFKEIPAVTRKLEPLLAVGLGYIRIGQETSTLSGGEFQRLRLSTYLSKGRRKITMPRLFIFDEPTTGLHAQDVQQLIAAMHNLVASGESVLVVEHQLDFIAAADHIIDMGPDAGPLGGKVVFQGSPKEMLSLRNNFTAEALRNYNNSAI